MVSGLLSFWSFGYLFIEHHSISNFKMDRFFSDLRKPALTLDSHVSLVVPDFNFDIRVHLHEISSKINPNKWCSIM